MNSIKSMKIVFVCIATVGFVLAIIPLLPIPLPEYPNFGSQDTILDLPKRANITSAIATSIAILLAIIATYLLVRVEGAEFKSIEKVKSDTILLANSLKILHLLHTQNSNDEELTRPYKQQITEFLTSTSSFAFDCWITQKEHSKSDHENWSNFHEDLLFISSYEYAKDKDKDAKDKDAKDKDAKDKDEDENKKKYGRVLFKLISLLENIDDAHILAIIKNLNDTTRAMEIFKKSNENTPIHIIKNQLRQCKYYEKLNDRQNLLTFVKYVLKKSEDKTSQLLLAAYEEDNIWLTDNKIDNINLRLTEKHVLNEIASLLYKELMRDEKNCIEESGFFDIYQRKKNKNETDEELLNYFVDICCCENGLASHSSGRVNFSYSEHLEWCIAENKGFLKQEFKALSFFLKAEPNSHISKKLQAAITEAIAYDYKPSKETRDENNAHLLKRDIIQERYLLMLRFGYLIFEISDNLKKILEDLYPTLKKGKGIKMNHNGKCDHFLDRIKEKCPAFDQTKFMPNFPTSSSNPVVNGRPKLTGFAAEYASDEDADQYNKVNELPPHKEIEILEALYKSTGNQKLLSLEPLIYKKNFENLLDFELISHP
jgi:hypothetical protein